MGSIKNRAIFAFVIVILVFFRLFIFSGKLPIPADTIIGLYHPFRDLYAKNYPNGIPFKNFLITDPVRQQYPWKYLSISLEKKLELPLWNPYSFAGTPHLANFQSSSLYPLNIIFFFLPFQTAWSVLVILQPVLLGLFLYAYLQYMKLSVFASILGAVAFCLSGFSVAWLEWNTILHVALWLPLILLAKEHLLRKRSFKWMTVFIFAEVSAILAGHLQTLFYTLIVSNAYLLARIVQLSKTKNSKNTISFVISKYKPFLIVGFVVFLITSIQWFSTFQFISLSARDIDQANWQQTGWFIPWQHLIQFVVPDFFGNPTTLNYWGVWNYAELIGYVGIIPFLFALFALFFRRDKKTLFFGTIFFLSIIFSLPTVFAKIPYIFNIPLLSTAQPTRLLFITDFSLAILAALGFDYFVKQKNKKGVLYPIGFLIILFGIFWGFVHAKETVAQAVSAENLAVAKRNLLFPTVILITSSCIIGIGVVFSKISKATTMVRIIIVIITAFDLLRFGSKFTPFTNQEYLFPQTKTIEFLQKNSGNFRIMSADSRILPPNFSIIYRLQSIEGYDPLYLQRYAELIAASERGKPDISPPFGFNRIITPHNYDSKVIDLLGVKYVLSLSDLDSLKLKKVFQEGQTRIYENTQVLPRLFFVNQVNRVYSKEDAIYFMFEKDFDPKIKAIIEAPGQDNIMLKSLGDIEIAYYSENKIIINTQNKGEGFLVFTDTYYPSWHVLIDEKEVNIYRTNYNFRGIFVSKGKHNIEFYTTLL